MVHHLVTTATPDEVFDRAETFFAERVPREAAFLDHRSKDFLVLRGQGTEELVIRAVLNDSGRTVIRAGTQFFDQRLARFLTTLPVAPEDS